MISIRLKADKKLNAVSYAHRLEEGLTWDKNILVWSPHELHGLLSKDCHVLIGGIAGDILICAIVKCNENIQQNWRRVRDG